MTPAALGRLAALLTAGGFPALGAAVGGLAEGDASTAAASARASAARHLIRAATARDPATRNLRDRTAARLERAADVLSEIGRAAALEAPAAPPRRRRRSTRPAAVSPVTSPPSVTPAAELPV